MTRGELMQATLLALTRQNVTGTGRESAALGGLWRSGSSGLYSEGGIVSGFTGSSAATCCDDNKTPIHPDWSQGYEVRVRFMAERSTGHQQTLCGNTSYYQYAPSMDLGIDPYSNLPQVWAGHSPDGASPWEYGQIVGFNALSFGVWYDAWTRWEDGLWTVGVKAVDGSYSDTSSLENIPAHFVTSAGNYAFGGIASSSYHAAQYVRIDMAGTCIKIGGVPVWGACQ